MPEDMRWAYFIMYTVIDAEKRNGDLSVNKHPNATKHTRERVEKIVKKALTTHA